MEIADILDTVVHGEALEVLRSLPDNSIDALCCDPPAGINFMNKKFDDDRGGRDHWIAWLSEIMKEALRVLKPGSHALVWSLPRTSHWTAMALEEAGFEIRDNLYHVYAADVKLQAFLASLTESQQEAFWEIMESQGEQSFLLHVFGSGFPKSHNISVAIDKLLKAEREVIGSYNRQGRSGGILGKHTEITRGITASATPEAAQYTGYGTALKPSCETWWLCRKPLSEKSIAEKKSIAENILAWGTGGMNIDGTRVNAQGDNLGRFNKPGENGWKNSSGGPSRATYDAVAASKRWPAHLLLSHSLFCQRVGTKKVKANTPFVHTGETTINDYGKYKERSKVVHRDSEGFEEIEEWHCVEGCPVLELDRQSGLRKSGARSHLAGEIFTHGKVFSPTERSKESHYEASQGGASRYFQQFPGSSVPFYYAPKASRKERNNGCEKLPVHDKEDHNLLSSKWNTDPRLPNSGYENKPAPPQQNNHPTVKPQQLLSYMLRMICPEGGIVLDCFAGSGSTGVAAIHENLHFILVEQLDTPEEPYVTIARSRIAQAFKEKEEQSC